MSVSTTPRTFADAEARLAVSLPGYESRPQQQTLARHVEQSIADRTHLLAEAGCGVGKSLGYLIPSILSGKRVIVSTATKALQDQIAYKDIPFLQEHLGVSFSATILKGRSNYLCGNKAAEADPSEVPSLARILEVLRDRADDPTFTGERDQLGFEIENREWMKVAADSDDCKINDCKKVNPHNCYAERARIRAMESQVVIVNHALYFTDMQVRVKTDGHVTLIGPHDVVVFDEAHEIEEYAGSALGTTFKEVGIRHLAGEVRNFIRRHASDRADRADELVAEMLTAMDSLWRTFEPGRIRPDDMLEHGDEFVNMVNSLIDLNDFLHSRLSITPNDERTRKSLERVQVRSQNLTERFAEVVTASFENMVRFVELDRGNLVLRNAPIMVAPYLRDGLFGPGDITAVLTSATLSVNAKFDYIADRLGIDTFDSVDVGTPFDFEKQAILYIPTNLPDPGKERASWSAQSVTEMMDLIKASEGRALVLFTSYTEMRNAYETISARLPYRCLMQGEAPNRQLAEEFKADTSSVLFATRSFMTGFDVQGESLSLVIIHKMPFPVPTEPITEARCEAIKMRGGSDFAEYTIPVMTLVLKQAYGRLIRHRNDVGVVAILDPRLAKKGYGKGILASLPPSPIVFDFAPIEEFYGRVTA